MTKIKLITDIKQKTAWNRVVEHPLQTWEWGEVKAKNGNQVLRVAVLNEKEQISRAFLFTVHPVFLQKTIINYAKGLLVPKEVLQFLKARFGKQAIMVKLEPEEWIESSGQYRLPLLKKHWQEQGLEFALSRSSVFSRFTFMMDLSFNEESLLSFMKPKTRYNINLAKRKGVIVKDETNNQQAFATFFSLYEQTVKRQNYLGHSRRYHQTVWETFKKAGIAKILTAYYQDCPLSSYMLFFYKQKAYYLYGGSCELHKEVMASNLLMWESIRLAKALGCEYFDLWGSLDKDYSPRHPWSGFHRFKEGFGGQHHSYLPTIDVVFQPVWYFLVNRLWPIRLWGLTFFKRFSL